MTDGTCRPQPYQVLPPGASVSAWHHISVGQVIVSVAEADGCTNSSEVSMRDWGEGAERVRA